MKKIANVGNFEGKETVNVHALRLRLNLGCGLDKREGYVNVDIRPEVEPDLVHDISEPLPFQPNSAEEIIAKDVLEHVSWRRVEEVLKDWLRVLKPGGRIYLQCPDLEALSRKILKGEIRGWEQVSYWVYGEQNVPENTHKAGFTISSLARLLEHVGFRVESIQNNGGSNITCWAVKPNACEGEK